MNKTILSTIFLCLFLQLPAVLSPAQPAIKSISVKVLNERNFVSQQNTLEGTHWSGQGTGDDEVFIYELRFKPKGKVTYVLAEYGLKDKLFYGTYVQTENSFVISFTGKTNWKIEGKVETDKIKCNRIYKNSPVKEYDLERSPRP